MFGKAPGPREKSNSLEGPKTFQEYKSVAGFPPPEYDPTTVPKTLQTSPGPVRAGTEIVVNSISLRFFDQLSGMFQEESATITGSDRKKNRKLICVLKDFNL